MSTSGKLYSKLSKELSYVVKQLSVLNKKKEDLEEMINWVTAQEEMEEL
jgi:hypothetical protein